MTLWHCRSEMQVFLAIVAMLGKQYPSSFAQSHKANKTNFFVGGRLSFHAWAMRLMAT